MNKVKVGFFSLSEVTGDHEEYVAWHQLDHMPEQFQIPGLSWGQRWVSPPEYQAARAVSEGDLASVQYVTNYLMEEPVTRVLSDFQALAHELRGKGRFLTTSRSHVAAPFQLVATYAAPRVLIAPEVVPYRPNTGVYVIVEQVADRDAFDPWVQRVHQHDMPLLLDGPGIVGAWCYAMTNAYRIGPEPSPFAGYRITVIYLDTDPLVAAGSLRATVEQRWKDAPVVPLLAGPFASFSAAGDWGRYRA